MITAYTCVKCGALPVEVLRLGMKYRFYCCSCGATGIESNDKDAAIESWNNINLSRKVMVENKCYTYWTR